MRVWFKKFHFVNFCSSKKYLNYESWGCSLLHFLPPRSLFSAQPVVSAVEDLFLCRERIRKCMKTDLKRWISGSGELFVFNCLVFRPHNRALLQYSWFLGCIKIILFSRFSLSLSSFIITLPSLHVTSSTYFYPSVKRTIISKRCGRRYQFRIFV